MSRASDYMEKWQDLDKKQPTLRYKKGIIRKDETDPSFWVEFTGNGLIVITQNRNDPVKNDGVITDLEGAKKFAEWIWRICQEN